MEKLERRQLTLVCNGFHRRIMVTMFLLLGLSIVIFGGGFLSLHFFLTGREQEVLPVELFQLRFYQTLLIVICLLPILGTLAWQLIWRLTYRTVGSLERIIIELLSRIQTGEWNAIKVRDEDGLRELVEGINQLLGAQERD